MCDKLICFDMNGVFINRTGKNLSVSVRPFVLEFLEIISSHFRIAFWSSMMPNNLQKALKTILAGSTVLNEKAFVFTWGQDMCEGSWPNFKKPLSKIVAAYPQYEDNILMVDDSLEKFSEEDRNVLCIPPSWKKDMSKDKFLDPSEPFTTWLLELSSSPFTVKIFLYDSPKMPWTVEKEQLQQEVKEEEEEKKDECESGRGGSPLTLTLPT